MGLLISAMLGARTADRPADWTFFLQKTIEWLKLDPSSKSNKF